MTRYLCPVCRAPRRTELRDELPGRVHFKIAVSVVAIAAVSYLVGGWMMAWQAAFLYLPLWAISEFVHWVKMRNAATCQACGFDPILYRRDWRAARQKVETRLNTVVSELKARKQPTLAVQQKAPAKPVAAGNASVAKAGEKDAANKALPGAPGQTTLL